MKKKSKLALILASILGITSLGFAAHHEQKMPVTASEQKAMTPDVVIDNLMDGNKQFVKGKLPSYDVKKSREAATEGQYPKAYILSCVDSRVPVEHILGQGLGEVFVGRVAGNVENEDQLGSMEYAAKYAGVKVIMVLGHESCGAVKGAIGGVEDGNLTLLLEKISPAIARAKGHDGHRDTKNSKFVTGVVTENVKRTVADIRTRSAILSGLEKEGKIKIIGGVYSLETGKITSL